MKILFLTPSYLGLYKDIEIQMSQMGHEVTTIICDKLEGDPYYKLQNYIKILYLKTKWGLNRTPEKFWNVEIKKDVYNRFYDQLFVIQGESFHPMLLKHLKKINPNIKSSLYIWDTNRMYDFFRNAIFFDKVYSFDKNDVIRYGKGKVEFLPFFWPNYLESMTCHDIKYKISSIGTNHDGRLAIYRKVIQQLKKCKESYFIKLISSQPTMHHRLKDRIKYFIYSFHSDKYEDFIEGYKVAEGSLHYDFIEYSQYTPNELNQIMAQSDAVLDTDNALQCGTTPRLIWALALNKHIFTTNINIKKFPFYDSKYIHIIDRKNPILDLSLIEVRAESRHAVEYLRLDKWLLNFLQ